MITVPKQAFEDKDEAGQAVAPEVGDSVNLGGVTVKIGADSGDSFDCDVTAINGVPVGAAPANAADSTGGDLRSQMQAMDDAS